LTLRKDRLDGRTVNVQVAHASCAGGLKFKSYKHCKWFATASTSTQVAVLPWRYDTELGTTNSLHTSA